MQYWKRKIAARLESLSFSVSEIFYKKKNPIKNRNQQRIDCLKIFKTNQRREKKQSLEKKIPVIQVLVHCFCLTVCIARIEHFLDARRSTFSKTFSSREPERNEEREILSNLLYFEDFFFWSEKNLISFRFSKKFIALFFRNPWTWPFLGHRSANSHFEFQNICIFFSVVSIRLISTSSSSPSPSSSSLASKPSLAWLSFNMISSRWFLFLLKMFQHCSSCFRNDIGRVSQFSSFLE